MALLRAAKAENQPRWGGQPGFYEVWYATLNHTPSGAGFWFRYTLHAPPQGEAEVALWGFAFSADGPLFAARQSRPISQARLLGPAILELGEALLAEGVLRGEVTDREGRRLSWDLSFEPDVRARGPLPAALERVASSFYTCPNLDVRASGVVALGSQRWELDGEPACQAHVWGRHHAGAWAWAHLNFGDGLVVEALQARPHLPGRGGALVRRAPAQTFVLVVLDGEEVAFSGVGRQRARGRMVFPVWHIVCRGPERRLHVTVEAPAGRFVQVTYHDPDGAEVFCANTEVAQASVEILRRAGREWVVDEIRTLRGRAHVEFGGREPRPEVPVAF